MRRVVLRKIPRWGGTVAAPSSNVLNSTPRKLVKGVVEFDETLAFDV
jgi:hypothetical protein